jgi:hypothetical protein
VVLDSFTASTPLGVIPMTNLVAKIHNTTSVVVIIARHYDSKRMDFRSWVSMTVGPALRYCWKWRGCWLAEATGWPTG